MRTESHACVLTASQLDTELVEYLLGKYLVIVEEDRRKVIYNLYKKQNENCT